MKNEIKSVQVSLIQLLTDKEIQNIHKNDKALAV